MKTSKSYNGYKNYAQWNQSLWINNDEGLYLMAQAAVEECDNKEEAANRLKCDFDYLEITHTPDGVKWSKAGIRAGMVGI